MRNSIFTLLVILLTSMSLIAQEWTKSSSLPEELGHVDWDRSYSSAIKTAKANKKPVFILFQEVPGCSTCRNYGNNLLTHPHIVEAIETYFTPLAIYNNKGGDDAEILRKFSEPSWNNPVARIIDANTEQDIVSRLNGRYDMESLVSFLSNGIIESGAFIPEFLNLLYEEVSAQDIRETHLSMYCFWSGEKALGDLKGVVATKAGFMNHTEVVKVKYDARQISEDDLISYAAERQCADAVYTNDKREMKAAQKQKIRTATEGKFKPDHQSKYYIYKSEFKYLPMTKLQALKVNTAISKGMSPLPYLSPRQLVMLDMIKNGSVDKNNVIEKDFAMTWNGLINK